MSAPSAHELREGEPEFVLELDDDSGPVSPRFQWSVQASARGDRLELRARGPLLGRHEGALVISAEALASLRRDLEALELLDLVDEPRAARVGARVNTLRVGQRTVRYLPSDVDERLEPTEATRGIRQARAAVLAFLRAALGAGPCVAPA